jgi:hypothetical protein
LERFEVVRYANELAVFGAAAEAFASEYARLIA